MFSWPIGSEHRVTSYLPDSLWKIPGSAHERLKLRCQTMNPYKLAMSAKCLIFTVLKAEYSFYEHGLTLIPAWINDHMPGNGWYGITYPFPNFNGCTIELWEWISNFIPHFVMGMITYPCWDLSSTIWLKGDPAELVSTMAAVARAPCVAKSSSSMI